MKQIIIFLLMLATSAQAQRYATKMLGCVGDGKIDLRWAPADYNTWQAGIKNGYVIERFTIMRSGEILTKDEITAEHKQLSSAFKPAPLDDWEPYADDKYAAIAAECIFGEADNLGALTPRIAYQMHQRNQQRFSFALYAADMSPEVAWLSGLAFTDKNIDINEKYLYKIYVNDTTAQDTAMLFISAATPTPLPRLPKPEVRWGNKMAEISLDLSVGNGAYTAYIIERSSDGGKNFSPLSDLSTINIEPLGNNNPMLFRRDTLPDNHSLFTYRIIGTDCFGRKSEPTISAEGHGTMPLTTSPYITQCKVLDNNKIAIEWIFPDSLNSSAKGFRVYKQNSPKSRLKKIFEGNDPSQRSFTDQMPSISNYYKISVYNAEQELLMPTVSYAALIDSFPPAPPVALQGAIDTTGVVTIRWQANNEADLAGYRVYTANSQDDNEFSLLTTSILTDTIFRGKVNLNTLSHEIFYQVRAIDKRDNHSAPSPTLTLVRPDTIAPVAPVMMAANSVHRQPSLQWLCSSSDDVAQHILLRKTPQAARYDTIAIFTARQQTYNDKTAHEGQDYIYAIAAEDIAGNSSKRSSIYFHTNAASPDKVKLRYHSDSDGNHLSWTATMQQPIAEFVILKSVNDSNLRIIARTSEHSYTDKEISIGQKCTYALKIVFADGTESGVYK